tara:strand:- start:99 stop:761 length:663 start_codon:yes stop_codon:yes gene_type:complete
MSTFTNLLDAVKANDLKSVRYLVTVSSVSVEDGSLPLAVSKSYHDIASFLLQHGANPNKTDSFGTTALHYAARTNAIVILKELLRAGGNPNVLDCAGISPISLGSLYGWDSCVDVLLQHGADPIQSSLLGVSPLDLCLGSILRRTKGLFDTESEVDYIKSFAFDSRSMKQTLKEPIDPKVLKLASRSDIKRLQRVLNMLVNATKEFQAHNALTIGINFNK